MCVRKWTSYNQTTILNGHAGFPFPNVVAALRKGAKQAPPPTTTSPTSTKPQAAIEGAIVTTGAADAPAPKARRRTKRAPASKESQTPSDQVHDSHPHACFCMSRLDLAYALCLCTGLDRNSRVCSTILSSLNDFVCAARIAHILWPQQAPTSTCHMSRNQSSMQRFQLWRLMLEMFKLQEAEPQDKKTQRALQQQLDQSQSVGGSSGPQLPPAQLPVAAGPSEDAAAEGEPPQQTKRAAPLRSQRAVKRSRKALDSEQLGALQTTWTAKPPAARNIEPEAPPSPVKHAAARADGPIIQTGATDGPSTNSASYLYPSVMTNRWTNIFACS